MLPIPVIFLALFICFSDCMEEVVQQNKKIIENQEKILSLQQQLLQEQQQQQQPQEQQGMISRLEASLLARAENVEDLDSWEDRLQTEDNRLATVSTL